MRYFLFLMLFVFLLGISSAKAEVPSLDEYKNVKEGILLEDKKGEEEKPELQEQKTFQKVYTIEEILEMYKNGEFDKAAEYATPLANNGHHQAEELLGIIYRLGQGVEKNPEKAFELLSKAAEEKRPLPMHHIGVMYFLGEGVKQNSIRALMWLKLSQIYYPDGEGKERAKTDYQNLLGRVTRRDRNRANELVKQWLDTKGDGYLLEQVKF